jgi:DNA-binding beta-propeller fold protein YncE
LAGREPRATELVDESRLIEAQAAPSRWWPFTGLSGPDGVAVDAAGNVNVTDYGNNRVVKWAVVGA